MVAEIVSVVALAASFVATTIAVLQTRRIHRLAHTPVVVITYDGNARRWKAANVGNSPALNIVVAQQDEATGEWYNPVAIPAISAGESTTLEWLGNKGNFSLGARYSDFLARNKRSSFFSYTSKDWCSVRRPRRDSRGVMPIYSVDDVKRPWMKDLTWKHPHDPEEV